MHIRHLDVLRASRPRKRCPPEFSKKEIREVMTFLGRRAAEVMWEIPVPHALALLPGDIACLEDAC